MSHRSQAETNHLLFEAAYKLSMDKGLHGWSLKELAQVAGIPLGNIFWTLKKKDMLVHRVAKLAVSQVCHYPVEYYNDINHLKRMRLCAECHLYLLEHRKGLASVDVKETATS